jgi:hypothetical protein
MIDGVKISFYSNTIIPDLQNLGILVLRLVDCATGEIHYPIKAEYKTLRIKISKSNRVEIRGSLHTYWKGENFSDFTLSELQACIRELSTNLNFDPNEAEIHNIEFGVNITVNFSAYTFADNVIAYKNRYFNQMKANLKQFEIGFDCRMRQYTVKVYDKDKQYQKHENLLRFEIAVKRMQYIRGHGITSLGSFLNSIVISNSLQQIGRRLFVVYEDLIINDPSIKPLEIPARQRQIYLECCNPKKWEKFTPNKRLRRKKLFEDIIKRFGKMRWKPSTGEMIKHKWRLLAKR